MDDCIFCKIANKNQEADIVFENDHWVVFHDIRPSAPVHVLLIPKEHHEWRDIEPQDHALIGELYTIAPQVAQELGVYDSGFNLVMNCGEGAGQIVEHFHVHLIGGWKKDTSKKLS